MIDVLAHHDHEQSSPSHWQPCSPNLARAIKEDLFARFDPNLTFMWRRQEQHGS